MQNIILCINSNLYFAAGIGSHIFCSILRRKSLKENSPDYGPAMQLLAVLTLSDYVVLEECWDKALWNVEINPAMTEGWMCVSSVILLNGQGTMNIWAFDQKGESNIKQRQELIETPGDLAMLFGFRSSSWLSFAKGRWVGGQGQL